MTAADQAIARDKFLALLKDDILQLDLAALDFGIYRILNYRRAEIDAFLDHELPKRIDSKLDALPGKPTENEQGRIFHHLYTFFARYYDDGDFVTRPRRGHKAAYSVPYNGQDVHFWWATKGSHYVKSGERFTSYVWRDGARTIRIEVAEADLEKDNVKGARRYYLPEAIGEGDGALRVVLAYRPLDKDETKRFDKKRKAGEDDEDSDDDEAIDGRNAQDRILNHWLDGNGPRKARIPTGVDKALLKKHLARYVAGQTQDFFVHPQLGGFLNGELDYYLKHEFLEIWDRADGEALLRERGKLTVARDIGRTIIAFLAAIEDVQAELFEKRKFVLTSDWLARVSALPQGKPTKALIEEACANRDQVDEWLRWLGEKPLAKSTSAKQVAKRGAELLKTWPHLCIHTRHFEPTFKYRLLARFEDIEAATGGTLIHSENYAALRTLEYAYKHRVKCIYIDPPYNTDAAPIAYKNDFRESSWLSIIDQRVEVSRCIATQDAAFCLMIDDFELPRVTLDLFEIFGSEQHWATTVVRSKPQGRATTTGFSVNHEYALFFAMGPKSTVGRLPRAGARAERYPEKDHVGSFSWANLRKTGSDSMHVDRPAQFYPIFVTETTVCVPQMTWDSRNKKWVFEEPHDGEQIVWPIDDARVKRVWSVGAERARDDIESGDIGLRWSHGKPSIIRKYRPNEAGVLPVTWWSDAKYSASESGTKVVQDLGLDPTNLYPKSTNAVSDSLRVIGAEGKATALDYFAGSGTTAHAVINLNREDGGARKFVLVEQGEYFDSVLLPRIAKLIACSEWKAGKPKPGVSMEPGNDKQGEEHWSARSPALVEVLRLERYEDSLDALELPSESEARRAGQMSFADEPLRYVIESAAGKSSVTLNHKQLAKPFALRIPQTSHGAPALASVDLAATALLLLGLHPVRLRDVQRKLGKKSQRYLFIEARPNGKPKDLHLLFLRDSDDTLVGKPLKQHAEAERQWLDETIERAFGTSTDDYATVWYNRDALLSSANGRSLDPELIRRMLERAPLERTT